MRTYETRVLYVPMLLVDQNWLTLGPSRYYRFRSPGRPSGSDSLQDFTKHEQNI